MEKMLSNANANADWFSRTDICGTWRTISRLFKKNEGKWEELGLKNSPSPLWLVEISKDLASGMKIYLTRCQGPRNRVKNDFCVRKPYVKARLYVKAFRDAFRTICLQIDFCMFLHRFRFRFRSRLCTGAACTGCRDLCVFKSEAWPDRKKWKRKRSESLAFLSGLAQ